jgi:hypothetical protein
LREQLRKIDLDVNGKMALLEYLCFRYNKGVQACIDAPQGDNLEEIAEAKKRLQAVQVNIFLTTHHRTLWLNSQNN